MVCCDNNCGRCGLEPEMSPCTSNSDGMFYFCSEKCQSEWDDKQFDANVLIDEKEAKE